MNWRQISLNEKKVLFKKELLDILSEISNNKKLLEIFLEDLLSPKELEEIPKRWQIVKLLHEGVPQHEVASRLKVSVATVTRGSRMLLNKEGGFNKIFKYL